MILAKSSNSSKIRLRKASSDLLLTFPWRRKPKEVYADEGNDTDLYYSLAVFGLGTMIYNGLELGSFFEIPWKSPCYQVLRGINPILQMIFTFSQMYFVFMNARVK